MKVMTLNTHSLSEKEADFKRKETAKMIVKEKPDIIALQEVNQTITCRVIQPARGYVGKDKIKEDNYASALIQDIEALGYNYHWVWIPIKLGYGKFEEGLALLSSKPIIEVDEILLSKTDDFNNWKRRKALGIKVDNAWYYTVHMGWWSDEEEPFIYQWNLLNNHLKNKLEKVFLLGDFNAPDSIKNQSYDQVIQDGYFDLYQLAQHVEGHDTAKGKIDGWNEEVTGMRIDYMFSTQKIEVKQLKVIFDGKNGPIVSDHFGLLME